MKFYWCPLGILTSALLSAQSAVNLPEVTVNSPRVANQSPAGTFAMPVSALRYEPRVDLHARNLAEGQADVTLRGGLFENTGFQVGAVTLTDPQTGHYFAEIPIAPAMLGAPEVVTGAGLATGASNATVGAVAQGWRPVRSGGAAAVGAGEFGLRRGEFHQGLRTRGGGADWGVEVAVARSRADGSLPFGDHRFDRANVRLQRADAAAQTDLFAGYQAKFFGWPNLYTPFNSNETENLQTVLFALNHRVNFADRQFLEAGVYHRRNKDDYAFNRLAPVGPVHPFQHTTHVTGGAVQGRQNAGALALSYRAEVLADRLRSTSLTFGRYRSRTLTKLALVPEKSWRPGRDDTVTLKAGGAFEDTSRDRGAFGPIVELAREWKSAAVRRVFASYTKTSQVATYTALNSNPSAGLFRGNPNLGRETSHQVELGGLAQFAGWTAEAAAFWRRDDALVDWTFRRGVIARTANAVDVDVAGFELVARHSAAWGELVVGYTALTKDADYRGAAVDASFYALNYARHRLTAAITARLGCGFELRVDNAARLQQENPLRVAGGDEALITSATLAYRPAAFRGLELALHADNVWDSEYQEVPGVPAARRQWSAGVSYAW